MDIEQVLAYAMIGFGAASALVPFLRFVAQKTANKTDDMWVERIAEIVDAALRYVPTIRLGSKK